MPGAWRPTGLVTGGTCLLRRENPRGPSGCCRLTKKEFPAHHARSSRQAYGEEFAQFSPDSKWIVYQSNKSSQWEIYVQAFPDSQLQATRISDAGGKQARWSALGNEIFYVARNGRLTVVPVQVSPKSGFTRGKSMELFDSHIGFTTALTFQFYVVSPDAQKFLIATPVDRPAPPLTVLLNWKGKGLDSRK